MELDHQAIALFSISTEGVRLIGRTSDPELVAQVRDRLAADRRREIARLEPPVRLVRDDTADEGEAG